MKYLYVGATPDLRSAAEREALAAVRRVLERDFGTPAREVDLPSIDFAWDARRGQCASIAVLDMLLRECPADASKLLAVTSRDLFIPVLTFVFGHAQLDGRAGAVSLARLRQEFYGLPADDEIFLQRAVKEAMHETGHLFGLVHCAARSCAMSLATGVRQIDSKEAAFCMSCGAHLRRLTAHGAARPNPRSAGVPASPDPRSI